MKRVIAKGLSEEGLAILDSAEEHHLFSVLRGKPGELIEVYLEPGARLFQAKIANSGVELLSEVRQAYQRKLVFFVGLPKFRTADFIVEKLSEIGVHSLYFFQAERTQGRAEVSSKLERWGNIARSAFKQSGSSGICQVGFLDSMQKITPSQTATPPTPNSFVLSTEESACSLLKLLETPKIPNNSKGIDDSESLLEPKTESADFSFVLGPEGGLTDFEIDWAKDRGFLPASLGANTLRVETAAILAAGLASLTQ